MEMINNKVNLIILMVLLIGCGKKDIQLEEDLSPRFSIAMDILRKANIPVQKMDLII